MILEDNTKLLHRDFHADTRIKLSFTDFPALYIHIDTLGEWNVDTRFVTKEVREIIGSMFEKLYNEHFDPLTVDKIIEAARYPEAMRMQYALLQYVDGQPTIVMRYGDNQEFYVLPSQPVGEFPISVEDIPADIVAHKRTCRSLRKDLE